MCGEGEWEKALRDFLPPDKNNFDPTAANAAATWSPRQSVGDLVTTPIFRRDPVAAAAECRLAPVSLRR